MTEGVGKVGIVLQEAELAAQIADYRLTLIEKMAGRVRDGEKTHDAALAILEEIITAGDAEIALRVLGPTGIAATWRSANGNARAAANGSTAKWDHGPIARVAAGGDAEDPEFSFEDYILSQLVKAGGRWVPLGDLTKAQCELIANGYKTRASTYSERTQQFLTLAKRLKGSETVRDKWSEQEVLLLMRTER